MACYGNDAVYKCNLSSYRTTEELDSVSLSLQLRLKMLMIFSEDSRSYATICFYSNPSNPKDVRYRKPSFQGLLGETTNLHCTVNRNTR